MIITTIQELRLASPAHALDSIDGLVGFIDNSEHDFLEDKLGTPLYDALCQWYDQNPAVRSSVSDYQTGYWNRLLLLAQRCVAFDALGRAIGMQAISVNNAGINMSIADDYPAPDKNGKTIDLYRDTCTKEAHAALNQLLRQLEQWCKEPHPQPRSEGEGSEDNDSTVPSGSAAGSTADNTSSLSPQTSANGSTVLGDSVAEREEIVTLWKESRYYYLAAALLIPSCEVLQSYLNIYDSREKFIQLLPDLRFIQEEIIANSIGEDLLKVVIDFARDGKLPDATDSVPSGTVPSDSVAGEGTAAANSSLFTIHSSLLTEPTLTRLVHRLRKVMVALLVGRTSVLKYAKEQKVQAHDDGVRMLANVTEYLKSLVPPEPASPVSDGAVPAPPPSCPVLGGSAADNAALWTAPLL